MIGQILKGLAGLANPVTQVAGAFIPNAENQAMRSHDEMESARRQFAREFGHDRTWWDSLINGLNRLPRPIIVGGIIYYFYLAFAVPGAFQAINAGLASIPEAMWWVIGAVIGFYFPLRSAEKVTFSKARERMVAAVMHDRQHERENAITVPAAGKNYDPEDSG